MVRYKPTDPRHPDHPENYRQKFRTRKNMAGSTASVSGEYGFFVVLFVKRQVSVGNCSLVEMFRRWFFFPSIYIVSGDSYPQTLFSISAACFH